MIPDAMKNDVRTRGFTLIELIISMGIIALIGAAVAALQKNAVTLNAILQEDLGGQQELRSVVKNFLTETRSVGPSATGAYPLATVATSTFMFYSDIDLDGSRDRIRYFLSGQTLKKGVIKPSGSPLSYNPSSEKVSDVVHGVLTEAGPVFEYYDTNYDGTTPPLSQPVNVLNVRLIKLNLTVDRDPRRAPGPVSATAQASMRNLKDNL